MDQVDKDKLYLISKNKYLTLFEKIDAIPVKDHLYFSYKQDFTKQLFQNEKIFYSCVLEIGPQSLFFANKKRKLVITSEQVIQCKEKKNEVVQKNKIDDLIGITKSLMVGNLNFVLHFKNVADMEMRTEYRDDIISTILQVAWIKTKKSGTRPKLFGVSAKDLQQFCTTEKDMARGISRLPVDEFMLDGRQDSGKVKDVLNNQDEDDLADQMFDEWDLIDKDELQEAMTKKVNSKIKKGNQKHKIEKEETMKNETKSEMVLGPKDKNDGSGDAAGASDLCLEDFKVKKLIDKGSFGKVFLVVNTKDGKEYAMKRINKDILIEKGQIVNTRTEKDILFQAKNPFILTMDYVFQNEYRLYFFLEYVEGGNLFDHLCQKRRLEEDQVKFISAQLLVAMGYLHANNIVHRDLKPENVLMEPSGYIKLADFGLAKFLQPNQTAQSFCGTAEYLAPEILDMKGHGFAVDWWTLGILIYEMVTGRPPFMHSNHQRLGVLIRQGAIIFPHPVRHGIPMSDELKDLITKLLDKNQKTRLGSNGDADELVNHPWFKGFDWELLMKKDMVAPFKPDMDYIKNKFKGDANDKKDDSEIAENTEETKDQAVTPQDQAKKGLITLAQEEVNDQIPLNQQKLIQKHQNKFKDF